MSRFPILIIGLLLVELRALAPVTAVHGNSDGLDLRSQLPQVAAIELDGFPIVVTHGDQFGSPNPAKLHEAFPDAEIIIFGHSRRPLLELVEKTVTVMNPGGAGAPRFGIPPSVGILELEPGFRRGEGLSPSGTNAHRPGSDGPGPRTPRIFQNAHLGPP